MENKIFSNLGKNFYEWYDSEKLKFRFDSRDKDLESDIAQVGELIAYVKGKKVALMRNTTYKPM